MGHCNSAISKHSSSLLPENECIGILHLHWYFESRLQLSGSLRQWWDNVFLKSPSMNFQWCERFYKWGEHIEKADRLLNAYQKLQTYRNCCQEVRWGLFLYSTILASSVVFQKTRQVAPSLSMPADVYMVLTPHPAERQKIRKFIIILPFYVAFQCASSVRAKMSSRVILRIVELSLWSIWL